jgi:hypothetical protein
MRSNSLLTDLLISTLWLALFYFGRHEVERMILSLFADLFRILGTF